MSNVRTETDTFGPIEVAADRYWGAQTQRSIENFPIGGERMPPALVRALARHAVLLAPFMPNKAQELWFQLGGPASVSQQRFDGVARCLAIEPAEGVADIGLVGEEPVGGRADVGEIAGLGYDVLKTGPGNAVLRRRVTPITA